MKATTALISGLPVITRHNTRCRPLNSGAIGFPGDQILAQCLIKEDFISVNFSPMIINPLLGVAIVNSGYVNDDATINCGICGEKMYRDK